MCAFDSLDLPQQRAQLQRVAAAALSSWGLEGAGLEWLGYGTNAVFRLRARRQDFVLRLSFPRRQKPAQLQSELTWLRAIADRAGLAAPQPIPPAMPKASRLFVTVAHPSLPPPQYLYASLFRYLPGTQKSAQELRPQDMQAIGRYLSALHSAGQFAPPPGFERPRLDADGLFGSSSPYQLPPGAEISSEQHKTFSAVIAQLSAAFAQLARQGEALHLLHGDLLAKNVLFCAGGIAALDFEFCGWGYRLYDLAPLLWQLKGERAGDYPRLEAALWSGYSAQHPPPAVWRGLLEACIAARQLASCMWLLQHRQHPGLRQSAPILLQQRTSALRAYLQTGRLQRQSATL